MEWHLALRAHSECRWPGASGGFTLIEAMLTLALLGLLAAVGASGFGERLARARADAAENALSQLLDEAREGAIRRAAAITVCPADSGGSCRRDAGSQLLAYEDRNGDQRHQAAEPLLRQYRPAGGRIAVRAAFGARALKLAADGSAPVNGSLYYCPDDAAPGGARRVVLSGGGRVLRLAVEDGGACGE